eukprot:11165277-Lingulodinium_polyedra.AAC.1
MNKSDAGTLKISSTGPRCARRQSLQSPDQERHQTDQRHSADGMDETAYALWRLIEDLCFDMIEEIFNRTERDPLEWLAATPELEQTL